MTRSESEWLLELIDQCGSKARRGLDTFFAMLVSLRTRFTFSKH